MTNTPTTDDVEQRVRHALATVAASITDEPPSAPAAARGRRRRRWWPVALGIGVAAVPLTLAASSFVHRGPEYVDTIPAERIVVSGSVDGSRYLLVESDGTDKCGHPIEGVELVEERKNLLGSEWSTTGEQYGELDDCGSVSATDRYLADPALYNDGGALVGDSFVWLWAVHPDVTAVRITAGDHVEDLPVHRVDGAGYALFVVPQDLDEYTAELLVDGRVVPGSVEQQTVPSRG